MQRCRTTHNVLSQSYIDYPRPRAWPYPASTAPSFCFAWPLLRRALLPRFFVLPKSLFPCFFSLQPHCSLDLFFYQTHCSPAIPHKSAVPRTTVVLLLVNLNAIVPSLSPGRGSHCGFDTRSSVCRYHGLGRAQSTHPSVICPFAQRSALLPTTEGPGPQVVLSVGRS